MSSHTQLSKPPKVEYPERDGQPMADNTLQFRWIVTIQGGFDAMYRDAADVFVAGDLLWYPVEGNNTIKTAPDTMIVFGRPKGDRGSYRQWEEDGIAPQVVFEVLSPGNRPSELVRKFRFYERYGVEEYYLYDPDNGDLSGWHREGERFEEITDFANWVSPRTGVRFELRDTELRIYDPDGQPFASYVELAERVAQLQRERDRAERLAAQLRALGVEPEA